MTDPKLPRIAPVQAPGGTYAKMIGRVRRRQRQRIGLVVVVVLGFAVFAAMLSATSTQGPRTAAQGVEDVVTSSAVPPSELPTPVTCLRGGVVVDSLSKPVAGVVVTLLAGGGRPLTRTAADGSWSWTGPSSATLLLSPAAGTPGAGLAPTTVVAGCNQDVSTVLQPGAAR